MEDIETIKEKLMDVCEEQFPKGECKERGHALVLFAMMWIEIEKYDEILEREVTKSGNSGHLAIPVKHLGKTAKVYIKKYWETKFKEMDYKK